MSTIVLCFYEFWVIISVYLCFYQLYIPKNDKELDGLYRWKNDITSLCTPRNHKIRRQRTEGHVKKLMCFTCNNTEKSLYS